MRGSFVIALGLLCACKATLDNGINPGGDDVADDAAITVDGPASDAPLGAWGAPQKVTSAGDGVRNEDDGSLSYSGLEMVFAIVNTADANRKDLFYTSRPDLASAFGPATKLPFSADGTAEETPRFSADDLTLFFAKTNGTNNLDIHKVTRPTAGSQTWSAPQLVAGVNTTGVDKWFMPCAGNRFLMIVGPDIAEGTLGGGPPTIVAELSSSTDTETGTFLTPDCLTTYFARSDGTNNRIFTSTRTAIGQPWATPTLVVDFAALGGNQSDPFISNDNRTFALVSNISGTNDVYISTR